MKTIKYLKVKKLSSYVRTGQRVTRLLLVDWYFTIRYQRYGLKDLVQDRYDF